MSNIYIQEPPTQGKVLLETTFGDIDIELWAKETPKCCRNFVQLCLEGYYNNTIFHRIVKGFIAQCGDPTGTGEGGESIYGKPFKDEFHTRLRFVRRGLVAMANAGKDDNGSQFFFTFAASPELHHKHTIFGKIAGDTIYNILELENCLVDKNDRPVYPPKILRTKVLSNPFPDIVPRVLKRDEAAPEEKKGDISKSKATKDFKLLSFGDEAEEDEEEIDEISKGFRGKSKSSHDLTDDPGLSSVPAIEVKESKKRKKSESEDSAKEDSEVEEMEEEDEKTKSSVKPPKKAAYNLSTGGTTENSKESTDSKVNKNKEELRKRIKGVTENKNEPDRDAVKSYRDDLSKYSDKKSAKKKASDHEAQTLALLSKFENRLIQAKEKHGENTDEEKEKVIEKPKPKEENEEENTDDYKSHKWLAHTLQFETHEAKVKDANLKDEDTYEIYDPRNPINQRRREASKKAMKNKR